jgi:hypothetical protein
VGQVQLPALQVLPAGQRRPHPPQLVLLVAVSTQLGPHRLWPAAQAQLPAVQVVPAPQIRPQAPQLLLFVARSRQTPLQTFCPVGQLMPGSTIMSGWLSAGGASPAAPPSVVPDATGARLSIHIARQAISSSL